MDTINAYINSGILELYVLGMTSPEETKDVNEMASLHEAIQIEIEQITVALQMNSATTQCKPNAGLKSFVLAIVDYTERLKVGEQVTFPPLLTEETNIIDFEEWTSRADMTLPEDFESMFAKIIGYTPQATTAIAWIKEMSPLEVHYNELERFFILEGSCDIIIGNDTHHLKAGDFMAIPLFIGHSLVVTSDVPCKVILQRVAA